MKNTKNAHIIENGDRNLLIELLGKGQTVLYSVENGPRISEALKKGYHDYFESNIELKEMDENAGTCGCGNKANMRVYLWK